MIETKNVQLDPAQLALYYPASSSWPTNNVIPLSPGLGGPQLLQGSQQGQRIGNQVCTKRLMFNFVLRAREYKAGTNITPGPNMVRIILFAERDAPTSTPNPTTDFFELGSSFQSLTGDLTDMIAPVNKDIYYKFAEKTFKIGLSDYTTPGQTIANPSFNNDYKLNAMVRWDVTKYVPKRIRFPDGSAQPSTRGLWAAVLIAPADGTIGAGGTNNPVTMTYWLDYRYTDA